MPSNYFFFIPSITGEVAALDNCQQGIPREGEKYSINKFYE
jgi:hypothetical protein